MIRAIVVDDDDAIRMVIKKAVLKQGIDVVGEASNGTDGITVALEQKPDCIFMDVEMDGLDGVTAARRILKELPKTKIIFITAHPEYSLQAFELYAFDYMVKPFQMSRMKATVQRLRELEAKTPAAEKITTDRLLLKTKTGKSLVRLEDIVLIQRENRSSIVITETERLELSESLTDIMKKLPLSLFMRSHKSYIINITKIKKISLYGRWTYVVAFKGVHDDALLTAEKARELDALFSG